MTFGQAIDAMKAGSRLQRKGWNGKEQYIELASNISYVNAAGETINVNHDAIGNQAIAFVGTSGVQIGWLASQADMLADDWQIAGKPARYCQLCSTRLMWISDRSVGKTKLDVYQCPKCGTVLII